MIYLITEEYGDTFGDEYTNIISYSQSLEDAETTAEELRAEYAKGKAAVVAHEAYYDEVADAFYLNNEEGSEEELELFLKERGAVPPDYTWSYDCDYHEIIVTAVKENRCT